MNIFTIALRELKAYFVSPLAYVIMSIMMIVLGLLFVFFGAPTSHQSNLQVDFEWIQILMVFFAPALTMRLLAEEQRQGTLELLLTSPVRDWEIVIGKYLASMCLYLAMIAPTLWHVAILARYTTPDPVDYGPIISGYLGAVLVGAAFLAIGLMTSGLTQNQIIAYALSFVTLLFLWIVGYIRAFGQDPLGYFMQYIGIRSHYEDFLNGVVDTNHIIYFVSVIAIALFICSRVVESRRWR